MALGRLEKRLIEEEEKISYYKQLLRRSPRKALLWDFLAEAYYQLAEYDEAIQCWRKLLAKTAIEDHKVLMKIGLAYEAKGEAERAFDYYFQALQSDRENDYLLGKFGEVAYEIGNYEDALIAFKELTEKMPDNETIWYNLSLTYYAIGELGKALKSLKTALKINDKSAESWYVLAAIYSEYWQLGKALNYLEKALAIDEDLKEKAKSDLAFEKLRGLSLFKLFVGS